MISVTFTNKYGSIVMGGGEHETHRLLEISGLGLPEVERNTVTYYFEAGQRLLSEHINARTITMSIELQNNGKLREELSRITRILKDEGVLYIENDLISRRINARCVSVNPDKRNVKFQKLVLQFICDYPYFHDKEATRSPVYMTDSLIGAADENASEGSFALPMTFSERYKGNVINNAGDTKTEPVIFIYAGDETGDSSDNVIIINNTTGARIVIEGYTFSENETLTIDIPSRKIYSSNAPDTLLFCISDDTFLSDFVLVEGENDIDVESNTNRHINAALVFDNNYVEALV